MPCLRIRERIHRNSSLILGRENCHNLPAGLKMTARKLSLRPQRRHQSSAMMPWSRSASYCWEAGLHNSYFRVISWSLRNSSRTTSSSFPIRFIHWSLNSMGIGARTGRLCESEMVRAPLFTCSDTVFRSLIRLSRYARNAARRRDESSAISRPQLSKVCTNSSAFLFRKAFVSSENSENSFIISSLDNFSLYPDEESQNSAYTTLVSDFARVVGCAACVERQEGDHSPRSNNTFPRNS